MSKAPGDRVGLKTRGSVIEGTVYAVDKSGIKILGDDGGGYTAPATYAFLPAKGKTPKRLTSQLEELLAPVPTWKKGDRAQIEDRGETLVGTITRGGARPTMIVDGGKEQMTAGARDFRPGPPLPVDKPSRMDAWTVHKYSLAARLSEETNCYSADIHLDGRRVIAASNHGQGGPDMYHAVGKAGQGVVDRFESDAKAWFEENGVEYGGEAAAAWIEFQVNKRPYGVTTEAYMEETRETLASFSRPFELR